METLCDMGQKKYQSTLYKIYRKQLELWLIFEVMKIGKDYYIAKINDYTINFQGCFSELLTSECQLKTYK